MKYSEVLSQEMDSISRKKKVRFIGYNVKYGHKMYGTLSGCKEESLIEMPVAENLMMGVALGMSLEGYRPIVCFERTNFLLPALDSIIHHLHALPKMSGEFDFPVIIRIIVPTPGLYHPGIQHLGDYTGIIRKYTDISVIPYHKGAYQKALKRKKPVCIVEKKELYGQNYNTAVV